MAPPSPRRPGFSRRAQYGIFATYVIAIIGATVALLLVLTARFDPEGNSALQGMASDLTAPVSEAGREVSAGLDSIWADITAYFNAASKNRALQEELTKAERKAIEADVLRHENDRLRALLEMARQSQKTIATAQLVSSTGASSRRYATLTAGLNQGVQNGQPVLEPNGLVGRIVAVGRSSARVLLIVDASSVTPVKRTTDGAPALAIGTGDGRLILRALSSGLPRFKTGDVFVTSGSGGIYRPGIPVARAINNGREGTLARPAADPESFDVALVEPIYQDEPPPAPADLPKSKAR
ncbi:MAG: rod shape-determining protein MreC [Chakrabartia sp.]